MTEDRERIRVRFAPSPTGSLHVGGARTAIFNWLFARHHGGAFVLRIEDTDAARSTRESEASLLEDLRWLGLDWDEGPDVGGPHAPYRQSERTARYRDVAARLVRARLAYPCFCTDEELERKRVEATQAGRAPQYDGTCRFLTPEEIAARRREGRPESIRFHVPGTGRVSFDDVVRGTVTLNVEMVGDFVVVRSNGRPTYNFAAAIDDADMDITHVIRGEEHLPNTLRQVLVHRAVRATEAGHDGIDVLQDPRWNAGMPRFAHVPLILAPDRSKLSKRHGASSVGELRARGFLPEAVFNYLMLLGWSHAEGREVMTREEAIEAFDLSRVGHSAAVFDPAKLRWMNGRHIRRMDGGAYVERALAQLPESIAAAYDDARRREIVALVRDSLETLEDVAERTRVFAPSPALDDEAHAVVRSDAGRCVLEAFLQVLDEFDGDWNADAFRSLARETGARTSLRGRDLYFPLRAALTGSLHGPDLSQVAAIRGRDAVERLVRRALDGPAA